MAIQLPPHRLRRSGRETIGPANQPPQYAVQERCRRSRENTAVGPQQPRLAIGTVQAAIGGARRVTEMAEGVRLILLYF
jgi:hypothetical protein